MVKMRLFFVHLAGIILLICISFVDSEPFGTADGISIAVIASAGILSQLISNRYASARQSQVERLSKELSVASSRIESVSEEIRLTINESDVCTDQLFGESAHMSELAGHVGSIVAGFTAGFKELLQLSAETGAMVRDMEKSSRSANDVIQNSGNEILKIVETINRIKESSAGASESIETLKAASDSIIGILTTINEISGRMKLIAVNASIEAARAGSAGNGFSVVAAEFKRLSESTETASADIEALIRTVKDKVDDVRDSMRENGENVDNGVLLSKNVEEKLSDIGDSFRRVIDRVERIRSISEAERSLAAAMEADVGEIEDSVKRTGQIADSVYRSADRQKSEIGNIAKMGEKLRSASAELSDLAGNSVGAAWPDTSGKVLAELAAAYFDCMETELARNPALADSQKHAQLLSGFLHKHSQIEAAWTNDTNGRFLCSIPEAGIANAAVREWFRVSIRGEKYISPVYISGITKNPCITLSIPYYTSGQEVTGVIGIDLDLGKLKL